ncbi:MAG: DNA-3-methyladenine glycosylase I [Bacteroidetes bacterium]|nr:MAG: DNA-3-methyladenine glycosylase I [Bacteroidota bacterium]
MKGLTQGPDRLVRCWWCGSHPDYQAYHDEEWGFPVGDDRRLFEKICLEGFQSGLSWLTILRKRENFRRAFAGFDFERVARYDEGQVAALLQDAGIVRHRRKIESTINNARQACRLAEEFGSLGAFFWRFEPPRRPQPLSYDELLTRTQTPESKALSKELKRRGWSFIGPTTAYAFMQAMGLVNDHLQGCHCWERVEAARGAFLPPQ